jgi:hypothetical protein
MNFSVLFVCMVNKVSALACAELEEMKQKYELQLALNKEAESFAHKVHLHVACNDIASSFTGFGVT